jgi:hypothetical protein
MDRYDYRTVMMNIADLAEASFASRLDGLGAEGWELKATISHERHGYSHEVHFVFMRRREPSPTRA